MAATGFTPISLYYSATASAVPLAANLVAGELALNTLDGKLYYKNSSNVVTLLASTAGSSGDVVGPASATDNALARFDLTTGKLIQNSVGILSDAGVLTGLTGLTSSGSITLSSLTSGRVPYATTAGLLTDSANLLYAGADLTIYGIRAGRGNGAIASNTAFGSDALRDNSGSSNTAIGDIALRETTTGVWNSGFGRQALVFNGGGSNNTAVGGQALYLATGSNNTAIGRSALFSASGNSTAVGYEAGLGVSGAGNQLFGYSSGSAITTGAKNVIIGSYTGSAAPISATGSNFIVLSDGDGNVRQTINSSGNVGIGTTAPTAKLAISENTTTPTATSGTVLQVAQADGVSPIILMDAFGVAGGSFIARRTQGTAAAPTAQTANNNLGNFGAIGYGTTGYSSGVRANMRHVTSEVWTDTAQGAYTIFQTTPDGTTTLTERLRISSAGLVGVGTSSATSMLQTAGSSSVSALKTPNIAEVDTISATAATGTINYDVTTQSVLYYTSNASGNWTLNFRGSSGTSLNTVMQTGESISATFLVTNGATAYYNSAVTIDGTSVTPKWQGGTAPTSGNASSTDCYTYVIQKTGSATYVVLASQTKFA
jgi:hypothetical protein